MSIAETLHEARKARLRRIAARAVPQAVPEPGSRSAVVRVPGPRSKAERDYERAWAVEILGLPLRRSKVGDILDAVAEHFGVERDGILSTDHGRESVRARHVAMYLARELTAKSFPAIGRCFGRDHGTVLQAVRRIEGLLATDAELADAIDRLRETLGA